MIESTVYKYALNVNLGQVKTALNEVFPSIEDLIITSRKFDNFEDAVQSANTVATRIITALNASVEKEQFRLLSEINPQFSGRPTISQEWGSNEIAKLWIVDGLRTTERKTNGILAIGLGQLLEMRGSMLATS